MPTVGWKANVEVFDAVKKSPREQGFFWAINILQNKVADQIRYLLTCCLRESS